MKLKIFILFLFLIVTVNCQSNLEKSQNLIVQTKDTPSMSDKERITEAKKLINKANPSDDDLQNAQLILSKISTDSDKYKEAKKLLQSMEEKRKRNPNLVRPVEVIEIKIGMDISTFEKLCGRTSDTSTFESTRGTTITLRYEFTEKRAKNDCWGTFTFRENQLDSIYRN